MLRWVNPAWTRVFVPWVMFKGRSDAICLTFDDGPHPEHTPAVLDVLNRYGVKGTFFLRGDRIAGNEALVRRMFDAGHGIGNHGWSHRSLWFRPGAEIRLEIERTASTIASVIGQRPSLFRPPCGRFDSRFRRIMQETDHRLVLWSLLSYDWAEADSAAVGKTVEKHLHPGAVLVFHDGHRRGALLSAVLPQVIESVRRRGLDFVVI